MAEANSSSQPCIPKFDGDYDHWSLLMENLLRSKEYWSVVQEGYTEPTEKESGALTEAQRKVLDDKRLKDLKSKNYLFNSIDRSILRTITQKDTAKQLWDSMKVKYQGNARVRRAQLQTLRRDFELLAMKPSETVSDYFGRVMVVANDMRNCGEDMQDVKIVEKILRTLTEKFNYVVCSIEESKDIDTLSVDALQSSLLVHEQKFKKNSGEEQVLKVSYDERAGRGGRGFAARGRGGGRSRQAFNRATIECFKCHNIGHYQYECPKWNKQANYVECKEEEEELLLMTHVEDVRARKGEVWFLDSGCSNHMSGDKELFTSLNEKFKHSVKLGNNSRMEVAGKGNIKLLLNGMMSTITEVYYVPELKNNLLSVGQLQEKGLAILIQGGMCKIYHPEKGLLVESKMSMNRMFILPARSSPAMQSENCLLLSSVNQSQLWHERYGHLNYRGLKLLHDKRMVVGLPQFQDTSKVCVDCFEGKQQRKAIPKQSTWRAKEVLELIHSDICGPISPASNSGKRYILCFIDDFSRKAWAYLLAEKTEALSCFKTFKILVEKQSSKVIKCLRTDRGGEFNSHDFNNFCKEHGIQRQLTTAYTPQQNGVAERKNRTVMNMVRSILIAKKVPKIFWAEAVKWTFYVLNRSPTLALKDVTPQEVWSGEKPSVAHFRTWGCLAHVHIPEAKRGKLDKRSYVCVLLGWSDESKGYRLFDPKTHGISISKDVEFEENKEWEWGKSYEEQVGADLVWSDDENEESVLSKPCDESRDAVADNTSENIIEGERTQEDDNVRRGAGSREGRIRKSPAYLNDYVTGDGLSEEEDEVNMAEIAEIEASDPSTFEEAVKGKQWRLAMDAEIDAIRRNQTWELTSLPKGAKCIGVKWVYKTKFNELGEVDKCKARLVAKGYSQKHGVDYTEVYAPVARMDTVRMIVAMAAKNGWEIHQLDVKSAFLHGTLKEDVYIQQPKGYVVKGSEHKVYKLRKALYGLKQASRTWFSRIEKYFLNEGFQKSPNEETLFLKKNEEGKILIVSVYVDDLIYTSNDNLMMQEFKSSMQEEFDMTDLGKMRYFLGIEVMQTSEGIHISQHKYAVELLRRFGMEECNAVSNPIVPGGKIDMDENGEKGDETLYKQIIGSLTYLTNTRPDLKFVVSLLSRYMSRPTKLHFHAVKRVLRYLKGTLDYGIWYKRGSAAELKVFTDSDYAGDVDGRKSTSGYTFMMSGGAVAWSSKKQSVVALSTTEAEYIAAAICACQVIWMRRILQEMEFALEDNVTTILCDNTSTIKLSVNQVFYNRSKHMDVRYHFLRNLVNDGVVRLEYCGTQDQLADIFTKPLKKDSFQKFRAALGICSAADKLTYNSKFSLGEGMK